MTRYMSHTSMTIPGYGISLSLMCLVRNLYVMVYFEDVRSTNSQELLKQKVITVQT